MRVSPVLVNNMTIVTMTIKIDMNFEVTWEFKIEIKLLLE